MRARGQLMGWLHGFFYEWMGRQQNLAPNTILSYRDSLRLLLRYVASTTNHDVASLVLQDLTAEIILNFLDHLEEGRGASVRTRNLRLAALHSFFRFVMDKDPLYARQCAAILNIPTKKGSKWIPRPMSRQELQQILDQPDQSTEIGRRDYTLLLFLYNTGSRISEALDLCPNHLRLTIPAEAYILGKGRKERTCPLWPETASMMKELIVRTSVRPDQSIFRNRLGDRLSASGARMRVNKYVAAVRKLTPSLARRRITPHTFRHTAATHLLKAGNDVTLVQSWLGHESLQTTYLYTQADMETKRKAIEAASPPGLSAKPLWKNRPDVITFLDSLDKDLLPARKQSSRSIVRHQTNKNRTA